VARCSAGLRPCRRGGCNFRALILLPLDRLHRPSGPGWCPWPVVDVPSRPLLAVQTEKRRSDRPARRCRASATSATKVRARRDGRRDTGVLRMDSSKAVTVNQTPPRLYLSKPVDVTARIVIVATDTGYSITGAGESTAAYRAARSSAARATRPPDSFPAVGASSAGWPEVR
jgi:hypothetical protein